MEPRCVDEEPRLCTLNNRARAYSSGARGMISLCFLEFEDLLRELQKIIEVFDDLVAAFECLILANLLF